MCSNLNNLPRLSPFKGVKIPDLNCGITLAKRMVVKRTITYREITVAIGILVAMVIALTLWVKTPGEKITESGSRPHASSPMVGLRIQIVQSLQNLSSDILPQRR